MNEQKNSVPEQANLSAQEQNQTESNPKEPEQEIKVSEQTELTEQADTESDDMITDETDYKSELEQANSKYAELEKKYVMRYLHVSSEDYDLLLPKARKLEDEDTPIEEAFELLAAKYPDKIRLKPHIDMGGSTRGIQLGNKENDDFTSGFSGIITSDKQKSLEIR